MKRYIHIFEELSGQRQLDLRRWHNINNLEGGKKLGEGSDKCVYDSNHGLACKQGALPPLPPDEVNVALTAKAFQQETQAKQRIVKALDRKVMEKIMVTLHDEPVCLHLHKPLHCGANVGALYKHRVLVRASRGNTSKLFASKQAFGRAVLNLVYGLYALHAHGLVHGDVKIHPGANNVVRIGPEYKLVDLGFVMSFKGFMKGIYDPKSKMGRFLFRQREYEYMSISHFYAMYYKKDIKMVAKTHHVKLDSIYRWMFQMIDLVGFMVSLRLLVRLNPSLGLKHLPQKLVPDSPSKVQKIVQACAHAVTKTIKVGRRHPELYMSFADMYQVIRRECEVDVPESIQDY